MYELSVAFKYLLPRWRQLSVSIISLISVVVIALVVWLIVVFFSVTHGLEKNWIQKLVAVTAPVRILPTQDYYKSYYYQIDGISANSGYTLKNINEKYKAEQTDPYSIDEDEEIPASWTQPLLAEDGSLVDLVKETFAAVEAIQGVEGLSAHDYEIAFANVTIDLAHKGHATLTQQAYIASLEPSNPALMQALMTPKEESLAAMLENDEGVLLPKFLKEAGARIGDKGWLSYQAATTSAIQEQRLPIQVKGFYDPGILPMGGKFVLAPRTITSIIRSVQTAEDGYPTNGIGVLFADVTQAEMLKAKISEELQRRNLDKYWTVETYRDLPPTRDLLQQLRSERTLFTLIASIVIVVACSNIVSLLIILVNDKKEEIGILRAMGASTYSIAFIFGLCGTVMGAIGSLVGISLALLTLSHIQKLVDLLSALQGHELLNPIFYGEQLPSDISGDALFFVLAATAIISAIAGIIPAIKACIMQPSQLLRTE